MIEAPFVIENQFYTYKTIEEGDKLVKGNYYVLLAFSGKCIFKENEIEPLNSNYFLEITPDQEYTIESKNKECVLLSKPIKNKTLKTGFLRKGNFELDTYKVTKPWGAEYWITGINPINDVVLKYIKINKGTKTSLQVHKEKFESNFLVSGKAIFRTSKEEYSIKKEYKIIESNIKSPIVINVNPLTIHQLESVTNIELLEASTNHLDDVIRLKDDANRADGRIDNEHNQ